MKNKLITKVWSIASRKVTTVFSVGAIIFLLFSTSKIAAQSIAVTNVSSTPVCAGNTVTVTFSTTNGNGGPKKFTNATVYRVYLSNSVGASYTQVGATFSTTGIVYSGSNGGVTTGITRVVTIPINTVTGSGYKISIGATTPTFNGAAGAGASAAFRINAAAIGGAVAGSTTVCYGINSTNLTLSGHTGSVTKWQSSTVSDFSSGVTDIVNTTTTLTANNLSATTYYRAVLANGVCSANSAIATITVRPIFTTGSITTTGETICYNGNPGVIGNTAIASGGDGIITYKWQANGVDIPNTNSLSYDPPTGLTTTTTYTRLAKDGTCNAFTLSSGSWVVTVSTANTWTGGASTSVWTTPSNWSCGIVPTSVTDVTIGASSFDPEISSDVIINSLTIVSGETLKVNALFDLTVINAITNNGMLTIENSGNLLQVNNFTNTGSGSTVVKRNSNPLIRLDYTLWSSPVTGQGLYAFSPFTFATRFYKYVPTIISPATTGAYSNSVGFAITGLNLDGVNGTDSNNVPFEIGKGYLIRMPWNHPTAATIWNGQFTGVPNNGIQNAAITDTGDRFNAIGNPYPSPISISQFAFDNSANIETTLYFWRKTNNSTSPSYCTWNTASNTYGDNGEAFTESPLGIIQTGQGFLVEAKPGATTVEFNNGQRIGDNANQFFRTPVNATTTVEANRIWLNMTGATSGFSQSVVGYFTNATVGADEFDSKYFNDGPIAFTSIIENQDYVIQGRPVPFDANDVVPMKYKVTAAGSYTIAIDHVDGLFAAGQEIFLRDNLTTTVHNLTTGAYTFTSDAGTFNSRFEVVYQQALGVDNPTFNGNQVIIYKNEVNDFVINSGTVLMASVKVFDIRGRLLLERKGINASQTAMTIGFANEILLVQITSEDGEVVTKKVEH